MSKKIKIKSREERKAENLAKIPEFTLMNDTFMNAFFNEQPELVQFILRVILNRDDLIVKRSSIQKVFKNLQGRSVTLDIDALIDNDEEIDVEFQGESKGAPPKRARLHSSMIDSNTLVQDEDFENLPESYVIFITSKDYFGKGLPIYTIDRYIKEIDTPFDDKAHIIYVNGEYKADTPLGKLIHDFKCKTPKDMYYKNLADRAHILKDTEGGKETMCKIMDEIGQDYAREAVLEIAYNLFNEEGMTIEKIARITKLPIEEIEELAKEIKSVNA